MKDIKDILSKDSLTREDLKTLISVEDEDTLNLIYNKAYEVKKRYVGDKVYYRGLIEFSNVCIKNCYYCGIRRENENKDSFTMNKNEILQGVRWILDNNYGSLALQSGERQDEEFVSFVEDLLLEIRDISGGSLGITLSLGEQSKEVYKRWFDAGATRYLLRIESSNKDLYSSLHPNDSLHDFESRVIALKDLDEIGYQVGTGVMIGVPGQNLDNLVDDILFYKDNNIDMIGMGPYILHDETPFGIENKGNVISKKERVDLTLKMIALTRIFLKDVNIAATTALQGLDSFGREKGIKAGANILMPITTKMEYKEKYQLYNGKPCIDDTPSQCKNCLEGRVKSVDSEVGYNEWGDSPHHKRKMEKRKASR